MQYRMRSHRIHLIGIAILCSVLYVNALDGPFFLDDFPNILNNPIVKDLHYFASPEKASALPAYQSLMNRYIGFLSFALNYSINGTDVAGYHVVNIVIHIITGFLLYTLVLLCFQTPFVRKSRMGGQAPYIALLTAALFCAHPLQTQAVTYIVQRLSSLATMFYLAALVSYLASRLSNKLGIKTLFYVLALLSSVLGMKTKEIVFTLPIAILLFELFLFNGSIRKRLVLWLPMGSTLLVIPLTLAIAIGSGAADGDTLTVQGLSRFHYLLTESHVLATYLRLLILPFGQTFIYDYPLHRSIGPIVLASAGIHLMLMCTAVLLYRRSEKSDPALRIVAIGIVWFYLALTVESTLVTLSVIFEHRMYLPSAGLLMGAAVAFALVVDRMRLRALRRTAVTGVVIAVLACSLLTVHRNSLWRTKESLWSASTRNAPGNILNRLGLGNVYYSQGKLEQALNQFDLAVKTRKGAYGDRHYRKSLADAHYDMGNVLRDLGRHAEAKLQWLKALEINPNHSSALNHLGTYYLGMQDFSRAIEFYVRSVESDPQNYAAIYNLAMTYQFLGQMDEANFYFKMLRSAPQEMPDTFKDISNRLSSEESLNYRTN